MKEYILLIPNSISENIIEKVRKTYYNYNSLVDKRANLSFDDLGNFYDIYNKTGLKEVFKIDEKRNANKLSKGMQKQLAIICGLCANTKYLICDETFDGLDPVMRDDILDVFLEFVQDDSRKIVFVP